MVIQKNLVFGNNKFKIVEKAYVDKKFIRFPEVFRFSVPPGCPTERGQGRPMIRTAWAVLRQRGLAIAAFRAILWLRRKWIRDYPTWLQQRTPSARVLAAQRRAADRMVYQPLFSFVTPVFNPPARVFTEMVASVMTQSYLHWELCLANGSTDPRVQDIIYSFAVSDCRIRCLHMVNMGVAGNSNVALKMARGDYIVLLDHDDLVAPNLLHEMALLLNQEPSLDLIYFDQDSMDSAGLRCRPYFKPARHNPRLLLFENYLTHSVIRRSLVDCLGGFDPALDGAQDWDLFFKISETTDRIAHIPKILYTWRQVPGSAAMGIDQKPFAPEKQRLARVLHLERVKSAQRGSSA